MRRQTSVRVLYDYQAFSKGRRGGIEKYFAQLASGIGRFGAQPSLPFPFVVNEHCKEMEISGKWLLPNMRGMPRAAALAGRLVQARAHVDVWHSTYYDQRFLEYSSAPMVTTVHDMTPEIIGVPSVMHLVPQKKLYIDNSRLIITVSQTTRNDLMRLYSLPSEKIKVVHHGIDLGNAAVEHVDLPDDFVLYVGGRHGYKNFNTLLKAWKNVESALPSLHLICVGGGSFNDAELSEIKELGISNVVRMTATDAQLRHIYRTASLFVFPSIYEGFGMPILEAFVQECPALLAEASCFPEIADDAASYFDPVDPGSLSEEIVRIHRDESFKTDLRMRGGRRAQSFGLDRMLQGTCDAYRTAIAMG